MNLKNRIVLFTNIKGGVGKTTLCGLFATYLAQQGIPVAVMDADIQQSLYRHRQRDLSDNPTEELPWQIQSINTSDDEMVESLVKKLKSIPGWVLIDCPGNVSDHALKYIYQAADLAIVPFSYDTDTVDATKLFCDLFKRVSPAKMVFIPNNIIVSDERREQVKKDRDEAIKLLDKLGYVTPRIKHGVAVKSYNTLDALDYWQERGVENAFKPLIETVKNL